MGETKITIGVDDDKDSRGFWGHVGTFICWVLLACGVAFAWLAWDVNIRSCERDGLTVDECYDAR